MAGATALLFGQKITQQDTLRDLREIVGPEATVLIGSLISSARHAPSSAASGIIAVLFLFFGASGAFVELHSALNYIWGVSEPPSGAITGFLKDRLFAFGMTSVMGLMLVGCLCVSVALEVFQPFFAKRLVVPGALLAVSNVLVSFAATSLTFSLIFRYVPARRISWRNAWVAGLVTAAVFSLGRVPLDLYLSHGAIGSGYGAAASVVVFLMWIYFAAQIFYLGGEFARLYSEPR